MNNTPNNKMDKIKENLLLTDSHNSLTKGNTAQKLEKLKQILPFNHPDKAHQLQILKHNLPSNHPLIQMIEGNLKQVEQEQKSEKLRKILPPN